MRILHIFDHASPCASNYSRRAAAIVRHQRLRGWKTMHMTGPGHTSLALALPAHVGQDMQRAAQESQFFRTLAPSRAAERLPVIGVVNLIARRLHQVVQLTRPQLLHVHSPVELAFAALRVGRQQGLPVVFESHAPAPFSQDGSCWRPPQNRAARASSLTQATSGLARFSLRAVEAMAAQRAAAVITNSDGMCARLRAGGVAPGRIHLVPDGLEPARYALRLAPVGGLQASCHDQAGRDRRAGTAIVPVARSAERRGPRARGRHRPVILGFAPADNEDRAGVAGSVAALTLLFRAMGVLSAGGLVLQLIVACDAAQDAAVKRLAQAHGVGARVSTLLADSGGGLNAVESAAIAAEDSTCAIRKTPAAPAKASNGDASSHQGSLLATLHARADIVVFPQAATNSAAGPPRQLLEAMARGCVIAAVRSPEHEAVIEHGRDGVLFGRNDAGALADALQVLIAGAGRWPGMRISARWFIDYHRSWETCVGLYKPVYEELLGNRKGR